MQKRAFRYGKPSLRCIMAGGTKRYFDAEITFRMACLLM